MSDYQRRINDEPYDGTDELANVVTRSVYDMPELYGGEDNPHPIITLGTKAGQFRTPKGNQYTIDTTATIQPDFKPTTHNPDYSKPATAKHGLFEKTMDSVGAGMTADGQLYDYARNLPTAQKSTDDFFQARNKSRDMLMPNAGMSPAQQAISSVASANHNRGYEYMQPMQSAIKNSRGNVLQANNEAESDFTYKLAGETGRALAKPIKEQWPTTTRAAHDSESSYNLLFSDNPKAYRQEMQRKAEIGANAIRDNDMMAADWKAKQKDGENLYAGLETKWLKTRNLGAKGILIAQDAVLKRDKQLIDSKWLAQNVMDTQARIARNEAGFIKLEQLKLDPNDPVTSIDNLRSYCYQSVLGQHIFDIALIYGTRGKGKALDATANILNVAGDYYAEDVLKNGVTSPWESINRGFQIAGQTSEMQERLNSLADRLDPVSSVALKFLIAQFSARELDEVVSKATQRKEGGQQRQSTSSK